MIVIARLVLGVVLLAIELHHFAFFALFGAIGAFAAALVALVAPSALPLQVLVAVLAATIGVVAVRPKMSNALHSRHEGKLGRGVHGTLIGEEVLTLDVVGDARHPGHVHLAGERWLAVSGSERNIPPGTHVLVTAVQGTTLEVWPVEGETGYIDIEALHQRDPAQDQADAEGDQK